jgi:GNAT superfamily N-acetyltransferase
MSLKFRTMDAALDRENLVSFLKDAFQASFGHEYNLDEQEYVDLITERIKEFPEGHVLIEDEGRIVGQIEMHLKEFEGKCIGFVNLFYLILELRGKGYGKQLIAYAEDVFRRQGVNEYHLRVSPTNEIAIRFYEKCGLTKIREELHQHVMWRMGKHI